MTYLGEEIKKLGFGMMRLPKKDGKTDIEQVKVMVDKFMEAGFTYFDTAWAYDGSEEAIKEALVERYPRESFQLATKMAAWLNCKSREEAVEQLETSLRKSGAGYFDFYLLHNLGESRTKVFDDYGLWDFIMEKKREGILKHIGFSFHSTPEELDEILTNHPEMEFVQLQINYADWNNPAIQSRGCYDVARKHNKPVVIMEPVKGGTLAVPPLKIEDLFKKAEPEMSPSSWAIRFAADLEGVITVLSGMSNVEQMEDNLSYMKDFTHLTADERAVIENAMEIIKNTPSIPCTSCNYCAKVCPANIGISDSFTAMNLLKIYENINAAKNRINSMINFWGKKPPSDCLKCGKCEQSCPQHIAIRKELVNVADALL